MYDGRLNNFTLEKEIQIFQIFSNLDNHSNYKTNINSNIMKENKMSRRLLISLTNSPAPFD